MGWPEQYVTVTRIAYALIIEATGNENVFRRRRMAEIPIEKGVSDEGWEMRTVKVV
jgi:hypothetical protein